MRFKLTNGGRRSVRRSRAIGRGDDAKMCVLAVENRQTFARRDADFDKDVDVDANGKSTSAALSTWQ